MDQLSPPVRPLSALVVDCMECGEALAQLLRLCGHAVQFACDEQAAIHMARDRQPDVAFLNVGPPDVGGYAVARRLSELPTRKLLLVALTAYGQEQEGLRALRQGFDHYLVKPVAVDDLLQLLRGCAERPTEAVVQGGQERVGD